LVHIKKLEIYGFKSFGFRNTLISFEKGLVAVTGPNGSGKSNILDAILFAIGENSPKALRVDKLQSLFHDSQNSSHRLIRVSLTFDNMDRGIPIDSDFVSLTREMEGQTGDSQYHLNGKKVSKTTILELLEVVMAAPNKINIVQQGMITRISELNVEERRKIIEDIVGLSYFDEKKTEALKQLEESDRRLEVALARMGEIRRRIDELEIERNDQLRYEQLESELKRFKAIQVSNAILSVRNKLKLQKGLI
jgi:chromosome segregation protein